MLFVLWACPVIFFISQNQFFGWNKTPQSEAELIVDGITLLLVMIAAGVTILCK